MAYSDSLIMDKIVYDLNLHLTYRLARLQSQLSAQASDILAHIADVSLSEWRILAILTNPDIAFQKDVLQAMGLDKGQISRTLKRLSGKGYIVLSLDKKDHRQKKIQLTPHGKALVEKIVPVMLARQAHLQSEFDDKELQALFDYIERLEQKTGPLMGLEMV